MIPLDQFQVREICYLKLCSLQPVCVELLAQQRRGELPQVALQHCGQHMVVHRMLKGGQRGLTGLDLGPQAFDLAGAGSQAE